MKICRHIGSLYFAISETFINVFVQQKPRSLQMTPADMLLFIWSAISSPRLWIASRHFVRSLFSGIMVHALSSAFFISSYKKTEPIVWLNIKFIGLSN